MKMKIDSSLSNEENIIREVDEILETNHLSFEADRIKSWKVGSRIWFTKKYLTASRNVFLLHGFVPTNETEGNFKLKARLVARGFEEENVQEKKRIIYML